MFKKIDEIWYDPFKDAEEIPETVKIVREAVFNFTAIFQTNKDITDEELLLMGYDPDMVNEFCMFDESAWPEIERYYQDSDGFCNMENAEVVGTKEYRARLIRDGIDPETELPIGYVEEAPLTYEQWKATLTEADWEFPHTLFGQGHPTDFVSQLQCEREEFEEMAIQMQEELYM